MKNIIAALCAIVVVAVLATGFGVAALASGQAVLALVVAAGLVAVAYGTGRPGLAGKLAIATAASVWLAYALPGLGSGIATVAAGLIVYSAIRGLFTAPAVLSAKASQVSGWATQTALEARVAALKAKSAVRSHHKAPSTEQMMGDPIEA